MKRDEISYILVIVLLLCGLSAGNARADFSYYIPDIPGTSDYPGVEHFDWINRSYTYNTGGGGTFSVDVTMYAPDDWAAGTYSGYRAADDGWALGGGSPTVTSASTGTNFNNVYSYFYKVTNSNTAINTFTVPFDQATVLDYGYASDGGAPVFLMGPSGTDLNIAFSGLNGSGQTDSVSFYMTSQHWWGWQSLDANASPVTGSTTLSSLHNSPDGMIPAPNPEASTVALYLVGLAGMAGFTYLRQRRTQLS